MTPRSLFGYPAAVVLYDQQDRGLVIDAIELHGEQAVIDHGRVLAAMNGAKAAGEWGTRAANPGGLWRVES